MNTTLAFIRVLFVLMSVLLLTTYTIGSTPGGANPVNISLGILGGISFAVLLIGMETTLKKLNLRAFNLTLIGLVLGYFMGEAVWLLLNNSLNLESLYLTKSSTTLIHTAILLLTTYLAMVTVARASEEFHLSIPFIKLKATSIKKKDLILDQSILLDARLIDLAASGLLDSHLILPRFLLNELHHNLESDDEATQGKARRAIEVVNKLEDLNQLELRYSDTDFPEIKDSPTKIVRLARFLNANILTADMNRVEQSAIDGVTVVNIHSLSNALKPLTQTGELIDIKIQRYGKEPRQGVGYLDDGTMVVINGGAEYIGESIKAQVLSVKHTTSGRMIFCNTIEEHRSSDRELEESIDRLHSSPMTL